MASFYVIGAMYGTSVQVQACEDRRAMTRIFMNTSARYPIVVMEEPGHKEVEAAEGFPDKLDTIRKAMLKAVASATHVVVSHFGIPKAYIFGPKDEADASRVYAGFGWYATKTMWSAGEDEAVDSSGNLQRVEMCDKLAHKVLDNAAACHAEPGATAECSSDEDHDCHDHSEEVDITCWMVGSKNTDDLQLKAYGDEEKARQKFNESARRLPTVLIGQPGNDVIDSSGDDEVVQKLTKEVAAAAASAKCVVVRHTGHAWGNIYSGDHAMASARNEYAHILGAQGQVMWCADKDEPLATNGDARCIDTCNDLARKLLAVAATAEVHDHSDDDSDSETERAPAAYWLIGGLLRRSSKFILKMYLSEAYAKRMYRKFDQGRAMKALILASNPGLHVHSFLGYEEAVLECRAEIENTIAAMDRVVVWYPRDHAEAAIFSRRESYAARRKYASFPVIYARTMWTTDRDTAVATFARNAAHKKENAKLAKAIMMIADTPPAPDKYYTITYYKDGEAHIKAYGTENNARLEYKRLDEDFPRALAGQPSNRTIESSPGDKHPSLLPNVVYRASAKAAKTVRWVVVCRVWQRTEAWMNTTYTDSKKAAVALYDRDEERATQGVWGADSKEAIKSRGDPQSLRQCEKLAAAILRWDE